MLELHVRIVSAEEKFWSYMLLLCPIKCNSGVTGKTVSDELQFWSYMLKLYLCSPYHQKAG